MLKVVSITGFHDKHEIKSKRENCMSNADWAVRGTPENMSSTQKRLRKFQQLNRLLWLCWLGLPAWFGIVIWRNAVAVPAAFASASPEAASCLRLLPTPTQMSLIGKGLYWSFIGFQMSFFFIVLWLLHRMVRKFASGRIFVSDTLIGLKFLGLLLTVWPFIRGAAEYGIEAALKAHRDIPSYWPSTFNVNFGVVAMGLFLLALKTVIENAIDMKADSDLTI
jgi:hypothetical protein